MPRSARALYFSMSDMKPEPLVCLPFVQTDPSISTATPDSCHQSTRHFLVGWKRYSGTSFGPLITFQRNSNFESFNSASPKLMGCGNAVRIALFPQPFYPADPILRLPLNETFSVRNPAVPCILEIPFPRNIKRSK